GRRPRRGERDGGFARFVRGCIVRAGRPVGRLHAPRAEHESMPFVARCALQHPSRNLQHLSLATRLSIALAVVALALLGAGGAWQLAAERDDLDDAVERELRMLGRSLQVSFENALRDRQSEDVHDTLDALDRLDPTVDVVVLDA